MPSASEQAADAIGAKRVNSGKGRWAFNDFTAPPLPRAAAVATDTEWQKTVDVHWERMLEELDRSDNPAIRERMRVMIGLTPPTKPLEQGLSAGATTVPPFPKDEG